MYKEANRPAWVEINLANLDKNIKNIKAKVGEDKKIIGIVKANAYGHGAPQVAKVLRKNGVNMFAIAILSEAIELRAAGITEEILTLNITPDMYVDTLVEYDIISVVQGAENAKAMSDAAAKCGKTVKALIAVDTGMGRIGYLADDPETAIADIKEMLALPNFKLVGMFSHMSTADCKDKSFCLEQQKKFNAFSNALKKAGIEIPLTTFANSAAVMEMPDTYYDAVRPGIILYGCYPSDEVDKKELEIYPVMSVKANIVHLKDVPAGFSVGYGRRFIAERPSRIATIGIGYADGYPRALSARGKVIVKGQFAPIAGNICMDQCMIDVTDIPDVKLGDEVTLMGESGGLSITAEDIAKIKGSISYEVLTDFGLRLPKIFIK